MERCSSRSEARLADAHGVKRFGVHDVEAAASIHQYLGEPLRADDRVDLERVSSRLRDAFQVVGPIKGYGGLRPSEEGRRSRPDRIDLAARKLLAVLGVIGRRPSEDHEAAIQRRKSTILPLDIVCGRLRVLPVLPLVGASGQEPLHEAAILVKMLDWESMV